MVEVNKYDTDVTIRYKCCKLFELPVKLISVIPGETKLFDSDVIIQDNLYRDTLEYTRYLYSENMNFDEIFLIINKNNPNIDVDNLIYLFVSFFESDGLEYGEDLYKLFNECYSLVTGDLNYNRFTSNYDLFLQYDAWKLELRKEFKADLTKLRSIEESQVSMARIDKESKILNTSILKITTVDTIYKPTIDGKIIDYGKLIFDKVQCTRFLTTCIFIDKDGVQFTKLYEESDVMNQNLLFQTSELVNQNCLYFKFNIDFEKETILKDNIHKAYYILEDNIFYIHYPVDRDYPKMLENCIEGLSLGEGKETKVGAMFEIYNLDLSEIVLTDCITNNNIVSNYLFLDETQKLFGRKKRFEFHFKSINDDHESDETIKKSVSVYVKQLITSDKRMVKTDKSAIMIDENTKYFQFNITQAISRKAIDHFLKIFDLLVKIMILESSKIIEKYNILSKEGSILEYEKYVDLDIQENEICNSDLMNIAPDLFVANYNKRCPCDSQPRIILSREEYDYWKNQGNELLAFPNAETKFWFVCPYKDKKFPGVKVNYDLPNKDKYPYIVCCWDTPHMGNNPRYQAYRNNIIPIRRIGAKADKKILTRKILVEDRTAYIPITLENILKSYSNNEILRYGIVISQSSIIHCICLALGDVLYAKLNSEAREIYVHKIRKFITASVYPSLLKQEMFDFTDSQIIERMGNPEVYFDPGLFYRAIEETFDINLYLFNNDDKGSVFIPRFKHFYCKPYRDRPCVIAIKSVTKKLTDYEHWELIADIDESKLTAIALFGEDINKICYNMFTAATNNITIIDEKYRNIYTLDLLNTIHYPPLSQFIDSYGKLRGVTFQGPEGPFTVSCLPSQPENLPKSNAVYSLNLDLALKIFGSPQSYSTENNLVNTLWYDVYEIPDTAAVYVSSKVSQLEDSIKINKLTLKEFFKLTNINDNVYKEAMIFIDLIRWLFTFKDNLSYIDFIEKCFINIGYDINYDFSNVNYKLPDVKTLDEALNFLKYLNIFQSGKIMVSDKTYRKLNKYFVSLNKRNIDRKTILNKYYDFDDFKKYPNNRIIIGDNELFNWLRNNKYDNDYSKYFTVSKVIHPSYHTNTEGYLYEDKFKRTWLIQNLEVNTLDNAAYISKYWIDNKINIGYSSSTGKNDIKVNVYGITGANEITLIKSETDEFIEGVPVLHYGSNGEFNSYAAMLQI